jgi:acyl-CoA-binding protein
MSIGNGTKALFWEDRWIDGLSVREIAPQLYECINKRSKNRTVAEGLQANSWVRDFQGVLGIHEVGQYLQLWQLVQQITLTDEPDRLLWRWTENGMYSAKSCYLATFQGSTQCRSWKLIWQTWAPPKVKFFHWLANQDRCWTADHLERHGLQHHPRCLLCDQAPETIPHLMMECPFSRQTWHEVLAWLRVPTASLNQDATLMDWWLKAKHETRKSMHKGIASAVLLTLWMLWKQRNECVFDGAQPSIHDLVAEIKTKASLLAQAGAKGLRIVLPSTWDVH